MEYLDRLARTFDSPSIPWKPLILTFSLATYTLESLLLYRQYAVLSRKQIPPQLTSSIDQPTYDKSQSYGRAKARFAFASATWSQAKEYFVLTYNVYPFLWNLTGFWVAAYAPTGWRGEIVRSLVFAFTYSWVETLLGLPWSLYYHFVLEEKFGFNKQTVRLFFMDMVKSQALALAFGAPLGAAFLWIVQKTGDQFFFYLWAFVRHSSC